MKLKPIRFQVLNYRNIDDSGWIQIERVTALVGRNESGKTSLLKALQKFNPAVKELYDAQQEFPRDRFISEYTADSEWPVCRVEFELSDNFRDELSKHIDEEMVPRTVILTRHYSGNLEHKYDLEINDLVSPEELMSALGVFSKEARRLPEPEGSPKGAMKALRAALANWANEKRAETEKVSDLRSTKGVRFLGRVRREVNMLSQPESADLIERFDNTVEKLLNRAKAPPASKQLHKAIQDALPVFIYFEDYGIVDSQIYLPKLSTRLRIYPESPRVRTINSIFKNAGLTVREIMDLGKEKAGADGGKITPSAIQQDIRQKGLRNIKLSEASRSISEKFSQWYGQRKHTIEYQADGGYFRVWVSDDKRPNVRIELENRSKGFQWFFSFYSVFQAESDGEHKEAVLLLDEPGLHLHPTAQQELLKFFNTLSEKNFLIYTTHSPFLIDGEKLHRVRPVMESDTGHSQINTNGWPKDRDTIFPLQAAAGYAMVRGLFQHRKNVLVEGLSDYLYLHSLNLHCRESEREKLPQDIYLTPCGGTRQVGHIASLFLGQEVRPIVLLDGDEAGKARQDALLKNLYTGYEQAVLMLDDVLDQKEPEIEDIVGEAVILPALSRVIGKEITLSQKDRGAGNLVDQIKSATKRLKIELPEWWKSEVARSVVLTWSTCKPSEIDGGALDRAEALFKELNKRFKRLNL